MCMDVKNSGCQNCEFLTLLGKLGVNKHICKKGPQDVYDYFFGWIGADCSVKNKNGDCPDFQLKPTGEFQLEKTITFQLGKRK